MKTIEKSVRLVQQENYTLGSGFKVIELVGRVSHRSEDGITDTSYIGFVDRMKKMGHLSTMEFCTLYLKIEDVDSSYDPEGEYDEPIEKYLIRFFESNPHSKTKIDKDGNYYITTNYRVIHENSLEEMVKPYICEQQLSFHEPRYIFEINCPIGIEREILRHRRHSFLVESTRYCNYSKEKFGGLSISEPEFIKNLDFSKEEDLDKLRIYNTAMMDIELAYNKLIELGCKAQEARYLLPLGTNVKMYSAAFESDWDHFYKLRGDKSAHPDIQEIAIKIIVEMDKHRRYVL